MRIALVGRGYSVWWGGAERVMVEFSQALKEEGVDVEVFVEKVDEDSPQDVPIKRIKPLKINSALKLYTFHKEVGSALKESHFDVVFGMTQFFPLDIYWAGGGVYRHWMKLRFENPVVRGLKYVVSPAHFVMRWLEENIMKKQNHRHIITNSQLVKEQMLEYFHIEPERVSVVYNGIDHRIFNPEVRRYRKEIRESYGIKEDTLVVLFVANNWERKGLRTLIRAMAETEFTLLVVGRGKKEGFTGEAQRLGIGEDRLIFTGPHKNVERFYGASDVFVLPTQYDPCSGVCLEAMATGLPVITTRSNGAAEFIEEGKNGFVMEDWLDHTGLAGFVERLKDRALRDAFAEAGLRRVEPLTWKNTAQKMLKICNTIAREKTS